MPNKDAKNFCLGTKLYVVIQLLTGKWHRRVCRGMREDENVVFRELKNSRILKPLCTHFNDTLGSWGDRDETLLACHAMECLFYSKESRGH